jgi:hypothetical protein
MAWQQSHFNFYENGKDHHLICFCFAKTTLLWKKRQNDYAKSNPHEFDFNMHAYYLIFIYLQCNEIKSDMNYTDKMLRDDALKGKVIVVTGGGSGLGKAMTQYFLELGAKVAITSGLRQTKNTASELEKKLRYVFAYTM